MPCFDTWGWFHKDCWDLNQEFSKRPAGVYCTLYCPCFRINKQLVKESKTGNGRLNVILRRIRVTVVAIEKQCFILCVCVCSLSYPACNTPALCCYLWPLQLYHIFRHYLTNITFFGKGAVEHKMCVLIFSTTSV